MRRALIIGLDGATFDLIDPLMKSGEMPALAALREHAAWGPLTSTIPPTTPPAWTTCTTGLNPGRHGIYDFTVSPLKNPDRPLVSSQDVKGLRLWDAVEMNEGRSIVVNVPITYPPAPLKGCMVSGMMSPGFTSPFTSPLSLRDRLKAVCGNYIINIDIPQYDTTTDTEIARFIHDLRESLERRHEAVRYLIRTEEWTFFMVVFVTIDRILHLFAKYLFPDNPLYDSPRAKRVRPQLIDLFKRVDSIAGELIESLKPDDNVFVLSDHGFGVTEGFFNANTWLLEQNLLAVHSRPYIKRRLFDWLQTIGDADMIRKLLPSSIQTGIRRAIRSRRSTLFSARLDLASVVDWSKTKVFFGSIPSQGFYINEKTDENPAGTVSPAEVEDLKNTLKNLLMNLKHPQTGIPLTDKVWFREEIFHGPETKYAPHVLFCMRDYAVLGRQHLGAGSFFTDTRHHPIGFHRSDGIIMVSGKDMAPGYIQANMEDVMPTLLQSMALPIPDNLDGKVLQNIFKPDYFAGHPPKFVSYDVQKSLQESVDKNVSTSFAGEPGEDERRALENRLKNLGYLE